MKRGNANRVAWMGLLCALCIALSFLEQLIPFEAVLPVGVKPGLSNLVILYAIYFLKPATAYGLCVLKGGFAFLTRGVTAGLLSSCGGFLSASVMLLILWLSKRKCSILLVSLFGAVSHNLAQLAVSCVLLRSHYAFYYLPVLLFFGILMGIVSAMVFERSAPYLERIKIKLQ